MVDKCEIKVSKSRNYLTEWPFVRWPFVGGLLIGCLMSGWPLVRTPHTHNCCITSRDVINRET